jgi:hypothetical protein
MEAAIASGADALRSWIRTAKEVCDPVPPPSVPSADAYGGRWSMRVPRSLHRRLTPAGGASGSLFRHHVGDDDPDFGKGVRQRFLLVPEQQDQDDDRDWHSDEPEQDSATHGTLLSADIP